VTSPPATVAWRPTVESVAALLRARTQDDQMRELGTFTADTRPTDTEVEELIDLAVTTFSGEVGADPCNEMMIGAARGHLALSTALLVELSYFPEQVASDRSPFDKLKDLWEAQHEALVSSISFVCGGTGGGDSDGSVAGSLPMPKWSYPEPFDDLLVVRAAAANYRTWFETWVGYWPSVVVAAPVNGNGSGA